MVKTSNKRRPNFSAEQEIKLATLNRIAAPMPDAVICAQAREAETTSGSESTDSTCVSRLHLLTLFTKTGTDEDSELTGSTGGELQTDQNDLSGVLVPVPAASSEVPAAIQAVCDHINSLTKPDVESLFANSIIPANATLSSFITTLLDVYTTYTAIPIDGGSHFPQESAFWLVEDDEDDFGCPHVEISVRRCNNESCISALVMEAGEGWLRCCPSCTNSFSFSPRPSAAAAAAAIVAAAASARSRIDLENHTKATNVAPNKRRRTLTTLDKDAYIIGQNIQALDCDGMWYAASVVSVSDEFGVNIHFVGFPVEYDETISWSHVEKCLSTKEPVHGPAEPAREPLSAITMMQAIDTPLWMCDDPAELRADELLQIRKFEACCVVTAWQDPITIIHSTDDSDQSDIIMDWSHTQSLFLKEETRKRVFRSRVHG